MPVRYVSVEAMVIQEIQAVETQCEQEQRCLEDQIADYENWVDSNRVQNYSDSMRMDEDVTLK